MQAQASVHDNSLTLQTQEADFQAVFMHLQTLSSASSYGAASLSLKGASGSRHRPSPTYFPLAVLKGLQTSFPNHGLVIGTLNVQLETVRGRRQSIVFLFPLTEHTVSCAYP